MSARGAVARYRCVFCRKECEGPERRAPPRAACGRLTARIVVPRQVVLVEQWEEGNAQLYRLAATPPQETGRTAESQDRHQGQWK